MTVISRSTKGKKDRMALAATENANVCTSVRNRYFTVELTNPEWGSAGGAEAAGRVVGGGGCANVDCWSLGIFPNPIRQLQSPNRTEGHWALRRSGEHSILLVNPHT